MQQVLLEPLGQMELLMRKVLPVQLEPPVRPERKELESWKQIGKLGKIVCQFGFQLCQFDVGLLYQARRRIGFR